MGKLPSNSLSSALKNIGFNLGRLKTGTPPRVCANTLDYEKLSPQPGDDEFYIFHFELKIQAVIKSRLIVI